VEPRGTGMVRREVRGEVEDRGVQGPSRHSVGHRTRRTPRSCQPIPWTRAFGPSPIRVPEARAGSLRRGQRSSGKSQMHYPRVGARRGPLQRPSAQVPGNPPLVASGGRRDLLA
jgi:hypothetical protein